MIKDRKKFFLRFLKENNAYMDYTRKFKYCDFMFDLFLINTKGVHALLTNTFLWAYSDKGKLFWSRLYDKLLLIEKDDNLDDGFTRNENLSKKFYNPFPLRY